MLLVPCYVSRGCNSAREVLQKAVTTHPFRVQITIIGVPHHSDGVVSVSWTFWQLQTRQASQHTCHGRHIFTDKFPAVQSVEPIPLLLLEPMAANAAMMLSGNEWSLSVEALSSPSQCSIVLNADWCSQDLTQPAVEEFGSQMAGMAWGWTGKHPKHQGQVLGVGIQFGPR
eukprot:symbB.v1.2.013680.t1/scaffold971.1/size148033/8